ncbi:MAG: TlpA family protein disulfide reductase [Methylococcaceae bacterium]
MKKAALIIAIGLLAMASGMVARKYFSSIENLSPQSLPVFSLPDLSGKQHSISEWRGKLLIINFWATWCPPCRKEIPEFIKLQEQYAAKGLQFIGVALDDRDAVDEYLKSTKINYPLLIGGNEGIVLNQQLGNNVQAVPYSIVVDQRGQIVYRHQGEFSREKILEIIAPLIVD